MSINKILGIFLLTTLLSCMQDENPYWSKGQSLFEVQEIFNNERLPNIVTAKDGTLIAVWGWNNVRVRRSEDGGKTWGSEIPIGPGLNTGGAIVDEASGDILIFTEDTHPPAPLHMFRSKDNGKTWMEEEITIHSDSKGNIPSMCMNEHGITLQHGDFKGRLIRPSRVYAGGNGTEFWHLHYTNAIYSDDGGKTWQPSEPFPIYGTGEAAIEELSDGTLYYNSRRHKSTDGQSPLWRYTAMSKDGGHTWENPKISDVLPDGNQHSFYGLMGGLVRLSVEGHDILLFSNIDMPKKEGVADFEFQKRWSERKRGTIWVSFDGGKTWPLKKLVDEGSFAYSSLAAGRKGTPSEGMIYLLYECDGGGKIACFNLNWLTEGKHWKEFLRD
ncbi:BNR repeat-like domain-containing protein [Mariniphaga anaerophila]|uniref:exo-alpha-sialidase n=1 Tax=Mariniphaga anaerophila TaxID=1484053 RepID=A0A1M4UBH8_9BACT|nr:sialidase family protein [Mariniphaga anaerophila]SHE53957.1 BNR repeat-like domain-containing protein [Mariniphaga anaerophila]